MTSPGRAVLAALQKKLTLDRKKLALDQEKIALSEDKFKIVKLLVDIDEHEANDGALQRRIKDAKEGICKAKSSLKILKLAAEDTNSSQSDCHIETTTESDHLTDLCENEQAVEGKHELPAKPTIEPCTSIEERRQELKSLQKQDSKLERLFSRLEEQQTQYTTADRLLCQKLDIPGPIFGDHTKWLQANISTGGIGDVEVEGYIQHQCSCGGRYDAGEIPEDGQCDCRDFDVIVRQLQLAKDQFAVMEKRKNNLEKAVKAAWAIRDRFLVKGYYHTNLIQSMINIGNDIAHRGDPILDALLLNLRTNEPSLQKKAYISNYWFNDVLVHKLRESLTLVEILKWRGSLVHEKAVTNEFNHRFESLFGSDSSPLVDHFRDSKCTEDVDVKAVEKYLRSESAMKNCSGLKEIFNEEMLKWQPGRPSQREGGTNSNHRFSGPEDRDTNHTSRHPDAEDRYANQRSSRSHPEERDTNKRSQRSDPEERDHYKRSRYSDPEHRDANNRGRHSDPESRNSYNRSRR